MLSWFTSSNHKKVNYEIVQEAQKNSIDYYLINTMPITDQDCLILGTLDASREESTLNEMLNSLNIPDKKIIVYGRNAHDKTIYKKASQLEQFGLKDVYIYLGGMFEWLLLQDIYGDIEFLTTKKVLDILRYKPVKIANE